MARSDLTYGDVTGEYLALRNDAAVVRGMHEALTVRGSDAVSFLNGILTQDVEGLQVGAVARSMLLTTRGKVRALLWLLRGDDEVILIADQGTGTAVAEDLARFKIRVDVQIDDPVPVVEVWGPNATQGFADAPDDGWVRTAGGVVARVPLPGVPRFMLTGDVDVGGLRSAGLVAATAVRVEAGEPLTLQLLQEKFEAAISTRRRWSTKPALTRNPSPTRRAATSARKSSQGSNTGVMSTGCCEASPWARTCFPRKVRR